MKYLLHEVVIITSPIKISKFISELIKIRLTNNGIIEEYTEII